MCIYIYANSPLQRLPFHSPPMYVDDWAIIIWDIDMLCAWLIFPGAMCSFLCFSTYIQYGH